MVARLAEAKNYAEIARRVCDMPQPLLKKLERNGPSSPCHPGTRPGIYQDMVLLDHRRGGNRFPHTSQTGLIRCEVFEISGTRVSKDVALMLTGRNPGKMTAADLNRHTRNHWGIEKKVITSATPYTVRSAARHGREKDAVPSRHSVTLQSGWSGSKGNRHQGNYGMDSRRPDAGAQVHDYVASRR